jgi:hypothetical protein
LLYSINNLRVVLYSESEREDREMIGQKKKDKERTQAPQIGSKSLTKIKYL